MTDFNQLDFSDEPQIRHNHWIIRMPKMTPSPRFKRLFPWIILRWINRHTNTCWARMVVWKIDLFDDDSSSWWPGNSCFDGPEDHKFDYCGRWQTEEEFKEALE